MAHDIPGRDPLDTSIPPATPGTFGRRGRPPSASITVDDVNKERLEIARTCGSASQYANVLTMPVERGDPDHIIWARDREAARLKSEWELWKSSGLLDG